MGSYTDAQIQRALDIAEWLAEEFLCTPLTPTQQTEEYPWPFMQSLQLRKRRIITVDTVLALHTLDCNCEWDSVTECAVILNALQGIINPIACGSFPCCTNNGLWCGCVCPARIRVTYTAGFSATFFTDSKVGKATRHALAMIAKYLLPEITSLTPSGAKIIKSWSSMDYSESLGASASWMTDTNPLLVAAYDILSTLKKKRFLGITGRGHP